MEDIKFTLPPHEYKYVLNTLSQQKGWQIKHSNIPNTWKITRGEGETALVIDTGHTTHTDIGDNCIEGKNFTNNKSIIDVQGHSTHVIGTICAKDNETGMVGVAPDAKCISAKALGDDGSGNFDWIINALEYALEQKVSVVSMSLGAPVGHPKLHEVIKKLYKANIPVICAAGNDGKRGVDYPAKYAETIAVAAYDSKGNIAPFSAIGEQVDWAAPGVDIYSTYLNNRYAILSGTSMACPYITGVVLLLLSKHKKQESETGKNDCKTVEQVRHHLHKYTVDKGYVGKDAHFGYGIVDVEKMILEGSSIPETPINNPDTILQKFWGWIKNLFKR